MRADYRNHREFATTKRECKTQRGSTKLAKCATSVADAYGVIKNKRRFAETGCATQVLEYRGYRKISGTARSTSASLERSGFSAARSGLSRSSLGSYCASFDDNTLIAFHKQIPTGSTSGVRRFAVRNRCYEKCRYSIRRAETNRVGQKIQFAGSGFLLF